MFGNFTTCGAVEIATNAYELESVKKILFDGIILNINIEFLNLLDLTKILICPHYQGFAIKLLH